jgi:hypothetical protein
MLEFDSISVSSYEADTLAQKLTEKSAAGWEIVSIVSAGSSVTAYLSRDAEAAEAEADDTSSTPDATESAVEDFGGEEVGPLGDADLATAGLAGSMGTAGAFGESTESEQESNDTPSISDTSSSSDPGAGSSWPESDRIDTPAASEPEAQPSSFDSGTGTPSLADDVAALTSQISDDESPADTPEPAGWAAGTDSGTVEPMLPGSGGDERTTAEPAQQAPAAEPAQQTQQTASAAAAAPAGWYADPSGRFELRYWDGGQWTEHVSRAGQQYTDPPVA